MRRFREVGWVPEDHALDSKLPGRRPVHLRVARVRVDRLQRACRLWPTRGGRDVGAYPSLMSSTPLGPIPGLGHADLVSARPLLRVDEASAAHGSAPVAEEVPVALIYNGEPFVVVMASPSDF